MMIRRKDIEILGLFDPDFFMYFEETELSYRYKLGGRKSAFVISAQIIHLEGKSFIFKTEREKQFLKGRIKYYKKKYSLFYVFIVDALFLFTCLSSLFICFFCFKKQKFVAWIKKIKLFINTH